MKFIAIDIGSSFIKSALLDTVGQTITAVEKQPSPGRLPHPETRLFEVPAKAYLDTVTKQIDKHTAQCRDVHGVLLSTQMHGFVYHTPGREDRYVSWQDSRCTLPVPHSSKSYLQKLSEQLSPGEMEPCGVALKPSLGICNLYAMVEGDGSEPRDGELYTLGSYLIKHLTGRNICHRTNAAPLGIFDVKENCWNLTVLEKTGFSRIQLPTVWEDDFTACGTYLSNGTALSIYPDYGDQQVSILGCHAGKNQAVINIATASQVSAFTDEFQPDAYEIRPFFEGCYINTVSNMPGGRSLDVLISFLKHIAFEITGVEVSTPAVWEAIQNRSLEASEGIKVNMSFFPTPDQLGGNCGSVSGISPSNLKLETVFAAAFEDMAQTYKQHIRQIADDSATERIVCAGGVSWKTPELIETIRHTLQRPCAVSPVQDESLAGLLRIALVCSGKCGKLSETLGILPQ